MKRCMFAWASTALAGYADSVVLPIANGQRSIPTQVPRTGGPQHSMLPATSVKNVSEMLTQESHSAPLLVSKAIVLAGTATVGRTFSKGWQRRTGAVMRRSWEPFGGVYARDWALRSRDSRPGPAAYIWVPAFIGALTVAWKLAGSWTQALLIMNVASFIAQCYWPRWEADGVLTADTLESSGTSHRLVTSGFLHASWYHVGTNVYTLWYFGRTVEQIFGPGRYIFVYLGSALAAALFSLWGKQSGKRDATPSAGASGGVFGILAALAVFKWRHGLAFRELWVALLLNFVLGATSRDVDDLGHIGGAASGAVIAYLWGPRYVWSALQLFVRDAPIITWPFS